jgi:hypothetical protein
VLAWNVEPGSAPAERRLIVQFNQPQKDAFSIQVQMQTPLGAFPQSADAMQLRPEGATRFAGYFRIVNDGAVRLEVAQASGLSQISPEQFPESDATRAALRPSGSPYACRSMRRLARRIVWHRMHVPASLTFAWHDSRKFPLRCRSSSVRSESPSAPSVTSTMHSLHLPCFRQLVGTCMPMPSAQS